MPIKLGSTNVIPKGFKAVYLGTKLVYGGSVEPWETVTGSFPITLPNAVQSPIRLLTQYGKADLINGEIICNNGTIVAVDDELPVGYKRITSIKFDGDFWYDTDETLLGSDNVTMTLADTASTGQNVFGSYNGTSSGTNNFSFYLYGNGSSTGSYLRYGTQLVRPKFGSGERTISFGANGTSGFSTDSTVTPDTFETVATAYIGMLPNSSSPAYTGSIVGNILVSDRLKYIPCERASDGAIGYYEPNTGVFLEPIGSGTPIKGAYDTSHKTVITVVGTPEVLTVSATGATTQTATVENLFAVGNYKDEQNLITGVVTRRTAVCVYDGTQTIGDVYLSTTGGKDIGAIIVYPLAEEYTENVTPQTLYTSDGTNVVDATANVSGITATVEYLTDGSDDPSSDLVDVGRADYMTLQE